jgi:hypothetical protein
LFDNHVGLLLHELLTGEQLFKGSDASETMARVLTEEPNFEQAPANVRPLLRECLRKDPAQRLRRIEAAEYLLEGGAGNPAQVATLPYKVPWAVAATLAVVAAVLGFLYFRQTPPAAQPLTRFNVDLGQDAVAGPRVTAAISPDGRQLAFVARGAGGREQLATRLLNIRASTPREGRKRRLNVFMPLATAKSAMPGQSHFCPLTLLTCMQNTQLPLVVVSARQGFHLQSTTPWLWCLKISQIFLITI